MPSSQPKLDTVKYGLLKAIDVSGFKVFDPVVRLLFGEQPLKQIGEMTRYMIVPIIFVGACVSLWVVVAPRHKTKSGRVPAPTQVWNAYVINDTLHRRADEKEADFLSEGADRDRRIEDVETLLREKESLEKELKENLAAVKKKSDSDQEKLLASYIDRLESLKQSNKTEKADRQKNIESLAEKVANGEASTDDLLNMIASNGQETDKAKATEKIAKAELKERKNDSAESVKNATAAYNSVALEIQHLKKRLDYLGKSNRAVKVEKAKAKVAADIEKLEQADTAAGLLASAKTVARDSERVTRIAGQSYPRESTIWLQVGRSLFTVFTGFIIAAAVAIPVGIMCGLNRIVMACLTPVISIFKPVSPVVWLLIFQIVVGAFFPDPATHPLFVFCGQLPIISRLNVNPAMIYSACTVAMCALWPALVNTALGVSSIDQDHLNVAKVLKLNLWARLTKIVIPSALPLVFAGLRISLGVGWMVLIAAEALSSSNGLGKFVWDEYQNGSANTFANIIFACFLIGIIGFFLDRIMIVLQRSVSFDDGAATV